LSSNLGRFQPTPSVVQRVARKQNSSPRLSDFWLSLDLSTLNTVAGQSEELEGR
jgi:hypothetical protein